MESVDAVVVGAGVVGLAVARALARAGRAPIVVERETSVGQHQSSRNSEVIHAGIYYPPESHKARTCVAGRMQLLHYCDARGIAHRRCGKLLVATNPAQIGVLRRLVDNAQRCGVHDLAWQTDEQARALEPALRCVAAVSSPSTAIVDSHALLRALQADAEHDGATLALGTEVLAIASEPDGTLRVQTDTDRVRTRCVVNAGGLGAHRIAAATRGPGGHAAPVPRQYLAKGTYFGVAGRPFSRLIYPVPDTASLGIHVTVDLAGEVRFGPDQQWVQSVDYTLDPQRAAAFGPAIRRYFPTLRDDALLPAYVGVRSKVQAPGTPMADFVCQGPLDHGVPGLVHLFGIESPGLTASLALAELVLQTLDIPVPPASD